ncbi:hypothetical protein EDB83DRAFT_2506478 [Lactarius deliciosus]|nr:hypothetical protein EDB83DRAFT_2506478 [Lactarius deliciosus]
MATLHGQPHPPDSCPRVNPYPVFLSFQDTLALQVGWAWRGLVDAFRWDIAVRLITRNVGFPSDNDSDAEVRGNALKSFILNGISLLSVYVFDLFLHPLALEQPPQKWLHRSISWFYRVLWLLPVVGVSLYLNASWCSLVAKRTFTLRHGLAFPFVWIARGLSLSRRIRYLEERWMYFFAFGLPSALLCMWGSTLANAALFALIFPSYIIMAVHAHPMPSDPYNPSPRAPSPDPTSSSAPIKHPSPYIPIRLRVFASVIFINDCIVSVLSLCTGRLAATSSRSRAASDHGSTTEI